MPDRIIRDEALNSDRLLGLKRNTHRLAFVACVLEADDLGNFEAGPGALWRLWRDWLALTDRAQVAEIMLALSDADLIRLYESEGKRYAHIPKFRQRLRYLNGKHPRPPSHIECKEISTLVSGKSDHGQAKGRLKPDHGQTVDARSEEKRSEVEVKRSEVKPTRELATPESRRPSAALPAWIPPMDWEDWRKHRGRKLTPQAITAQVAKLGALRQKGHDPGACIRLAIESGWATFYEPRGKPTHNHDKRAATAAAMYGADHAQPTNEPTDITAEARRVA